MLHANACVSVRARASARTLSERTAFDQSRRAVVVLRRTPWRRGPGVAGRPVLGGAGHSRAAQIDGPCEHASQALATANPAKADNCRQSRSENGFTLASQLPQQKRSAFICVCERAKYDSAPFPHAL